jgi:antitoxin MazE
VRRYPREGWAEDASRLAGEGENGLVWPEFANEDDRDLTW